MTRPGLRTPAALQPGDRIAVVSPASPSTRDEIDRGMAELRRLGFTPVCDDSVFAREAGYLSGAAELRAASFLRYWADPSIRALIAVRGGYGSVEMLPLLDPDTLARTPKLFIGYSDNTSLLSWLTCRCGIAALHGPMLERRLAGGPSAYDEPSFVSLLSNGAGLQLSPDGLVALGDGDATGPLYGGTLTQLAASLGTPYAFDPPEGCILFLEDVNERPYRIDRLLTQLRFAGILSRARALLFGEMRGCDEPGGGPAAREVIARATRDCAGPVVVGFPSGHTTGPCWTLPLGVRVRLSTIPTPSVRIEESPVG